MLKKIMMVVLASGAVAINAPAVFASGHLSGDCSYDSADIDGTYKGAAVGYGVNANGGPVTVHCEVRVGSETNPASAATPPGSGTGAATTAGPVEFTAAESETVWFCAVVSDGLATVDFCDKVRPWKFPPPGTWEQLDRTLWLFWDLVDHGGWLCRDLASLQGNYAGEVTIDPDGDVWVDGTREFDCPVYDD